MNWLGKLSGLKQNEVSNFTRSAKVRMKKMCVCSQEATSDLRKQSQWNGEPGSEEAVSRQSLLLQETWLQGKGEQGKVGLKEAFF